MLYELVLSYESADWGKITSLAEKLGVPNNVLTTVYFNCIETVNTLWSQLTNASPHQPAAAEGETEVPDLDEEDWDDEE
jgi:EAL and modified HD-GYP domain-containing signal transduction protein